MINPVLVREWKAFFHEKYPYYYLMFYAVLHLLIFLGVVSSVLHGGEISAWMLEKVGKELAGKLFGVQLILIMFLFPSFLVKLMSSEKEDGSIDLIRIVPYGYWKICVWKYITSILIWSLMILLILPLLLFSLSLSGITIMELIILLSLLIIFILFCGMIGVLWTFLLCKPNLSLVATYITIFVIVGVYAYLFYPQSHVLRFLLYSF